MVPDFEEDTTTRVPAGSRGLRVLSAELVVVDGAARGRRAAFRNGTAKVGTAVGMDLRLEDPSVSRVHCELQLRASTISLRDSGSTNGTFVDGIRIRDGEVPPGALVRVGGTVFRVEAGQEPEFVAISERAHFEELVGGSLEMRRLYAVLERVAATDSTILVEGETGTGKDVVARSIHAASRRASGPFLPIDCGAIPQNLIESELFGHVRGSFSGATGDRKGVFEEAQGGTLFLDEIGEMPLSLQPKLLRALETRSIRPVGANVSKPIDVRIVAATNRPLSRCVNDGTFREDLYYRLAVVELSLPPLRARREDVPELAAHFFHALARDPGDVRDLPPEFVGRLVTRSWPGNVRELRNFIERSVALGFLEPARGGQAPPPSTGRPAGPPVVPLHLPLKDARLAWIADFEHVYVRSMLERTRGNLTHAAELAGVSRRFLQRLVARLGIRGGDAGGPDDDTA